MKKLSLIIGIIGTTVCLLIALFYMFVLSGAFAIFMPNPPEPEITYGEFPFTLTYELNGEITTYEDVIICEYAGVESLGTAGKERKWESRLKSGNERLTILDLRSLKEENDLRQIILELYFYYGNGAYYMGDTKDSFARSAQDLDIIEYKYQTTKGEIYSGAYKADEAFEKYKIRLISWECAPPIENSFE